jgi:hypothetical protein
MNRYREARRRLLVLTNVDKLEEFPELLEHHAHAKNVATSRVIGDGSSTDSWIWTFGRLKGLTEMEKGEFVVASELALCFILKYTITKLHTVEKVQWFRARADMMRWVEEVELLEEDFRRLIRGLEKMAEIWSNLSGKHPPILDFHHYMTELSKESSDSLNPWKITTPTMNRRVGDDNVVVFQGYTAYAL